MNLGQYSTSLVILKHFNESLSSDINYSIALSYQSSKKELNYVEWVHDWKTAYKGLSEEILRAKLAAFNDKASEKFKGDFVKWQSTKNLILHYLRQLATIMLEIRHNMRKWNKREGFRK